MIPPRPFRCTKARRAAFPPSGVLTVLPFRFLFVDVSAVLQHDIQQVCSRICAVDLALESSLYEKRDPAAVVDVRMAQDEVLYLGRIKRKRLIVQFFLRLSALELSAVQQHLVICCRNQMA